MFHAGGHQVSRGRSSALGKLHSNILDHPDWKAPLRCGVLFVTASCVLFVIGVILTWLGRSIHDVFGESVPITGPILLAVGALMTLLALRQFYIAHGRKKKHNASIKMGKVPGKNGNDEDERLRDKSELGQIDEEDEAGDSEACEKPPLLHHGMMSHSHDGEHSTYLYPPIANPYYSMALMVYKDPASLYSAMLAGHVDPRCATYLADHLRQLQQHHDSIQEYNSHQDPGDPATNESMNVENFESNVSPKSEQDNVPVLPDATHIPSTSSVVLEAASLPLPLSASSSQSSSFVQAETHTAATIEPVTSYPEPALPKSGQEPPKIFPSDYLQPSKTNSSQAQQSAKAGISNLPGNTAFMMIRTLELQGTI